MEENQNPFPSLLEECSFILKIVFLSLAFLGLGSLYLVALQRHDLALAQLSGIASTLLWTVSAVRAIPPGLRNSTDPTRPRLSLFLPSLIASLVTAVTIWCYGTNRVIVGSVALLLGLLFVFLSISNHQKQFRKPLEDYEPQAR
jgi:hypothetical protein